MARRLRVGQRWWVRVLVVASIGLTLCGAGVRADVWYVDTDAAGADLGTSWTNAYRDLQSALAVAISDDEIWVAEGIYKPTVPIGREATFQLKSGVALYGGFAGTETSRSQRNCEFRKTTLSGDVGVAGDSSDNCYHVVTGSGTDNSSVLDGFTITAGNADGDSSPDFFGGGMLIAPGSPAVANCGFVGNSGDSGAGLAIAAAGANPTVTNCTFRSNLLVKRPGSSSGGGGGIIIFEDANATITGCTFDSNLGGLYGSGGGICVAIRSSAVIDDCLFVGNTAGAGGGIRVGDSSTVSLSNCTFSENSASMYGGAADCSLTSGSLTLVHCSLTGNTAGGYGGGIRVSSGVTTLGATIVTGGSAPSGGPDIYGSITSDGYNLVGDPTDCTGLAATDIAGVDPMLGSLTDNGGPTLTHRLLFGSPAIDAVPCGVFPGVTADQRGVTRPIGASCDIGAYEAPPLGDVNGDGVLNVLDVRLCLQIARGVLMGSAAQREAADLDGDGDVDLADAVTMARFVIGM